MPFRTFRQFFVERSKYAVRAFEQQNAGFRRIDDLKIIGQDLAGDICQRSGQFNAGRPAAHDDERDIFRSSGKVRFAFGKFESKQHAASPIGKLLGSETDRAGRVLVQNDLSIPNDKDIFVIGDMASIKQANGQPVPGVSPAAMQMGKAAAQNILADIAGEPRKDFVYRDKGSMATIGKKKAIADIRGWRFSGFLAWLFWLLVHITFLIGFRNRLFVLASWFWAYLTRSRGSLLITGEAEDLRDAVSFLGGDRARVVMDELAQRRRPRPNK